MQPSLFYLIFCFVYQIGQRFVFCVMSKMVFYVNKQFEIQICSLGITHSNLAVIRVGHGYGKTRGFSKTGSAGTGTVFDFGNPRHTVTHTRGIAGMYGYYYHRVRVIFWCFKSHFSSHFLIVFQCVTP